MFLVTRFFKWLFFELNLRLNVPEALWYFDQNNGVTMAVHGRHAERVSHSMRTLRQSQASTNNYLRLWVHECFSANKVLFFSNHPALRHPVGYRGLGYVVGSLTEFELFCREFQLERHALEIPDVRQIDQGEGPHLGHMILKDDFKLVIAYARIIGQKSKLLQSL